MLTGKESSNANQVVLEANSSIVSLWRRGACGTPFSSIQSDRVSSPLAFISDLTVELTGGHKLAAARFDPPISGAPSNWRREQRCCSDPGDAIPQKNAHLSGNRTNLLVNRSRMMFATAFASRERQ
jgi:hypothetical protein